MSSAPRNVALVVVHGMGIQRPRETMQKLVDGMQQVAKERGRELKVSHSTPTSPMTLEITGNETRLYFYEVFWADLLECDSFCCFDRAMLIDAAWYPMLNWLKDVEQAKQRYGFIRTFAWTLVAVPLAALLWYAYEFLHLLWPFFSGKKRNRVKADPNRGRIAAYNGLDDLLDRTIGDVFTYVRSAGGLFHYNEDRRLICSRVLAAFDRQMRFASEKCEQVHVLAHSLGTVVAYHGLLGFGRQQEWAPRGKVERFFTIGSPLEKFRFIWPRSVPPIQSLASGPVSWHNFHSPFDLISSKLTNFDQVCPVGNHKVYCGGLASAHTHYEVNESFLRAVTDALFGIPLESRSGALTRLRASIHSLVESSAILILVLLLAALGLGFTLGITWLLAAGVQWICNFLLSPETSEVIFTQLLYWLFGFTIFGVVIGTFTVSRRAEFEQWRNVNWLENVCNQSTRSEDAQVAAGAWLQKGLLEWEKGALKVALESFSAAVEKSATTTISAYAYFYRANIHWKLGSRDAAFADLEAAERLGEPNLTPRVILQTAFYKGICGDRDAQRLAYQRVLETKHPGASATAHLHLGDELLTEDRSDEALAAFTRSEQLARIARDSDDVTSAAMRLGRMARARGHIEEAVEAFERAEHAGGKDSPRAAIELALIFEHLERFDDACKALQRAENNGNDEQACEALMELARLHVKADRLDGAIDAFERAARIAEGDYRQYCDAFGGAVYLQAGRMAEAETWASRAAAGPVARHASRGLLVLASIHAQGGDIEKAIEETTKAEELGAVEEAKAIRASIERLNSAVDVSPTQTQEQASAGPALV